MADLPSTIGRYEVVSRLGQGGMGSLFLAKDPKIGRLLAIKLVRQEFDSPDARTRFAREAQSAGTLRHQNIVTIFDVDEHEGLPFIAMEYIDGQTLGEIVRRKASIDLYKRLQWIEDLCGALAYAHRQGVIHRDIKPANLMVDTDGTLKILDFGLARRDASTFTQTQTLIGTPNYMSPEQIKGGDIDTRSDIFSVGSVLYELLAYAPAFPGSVHQAMHKILNETPVPIETVVPGLDPRVGAVIQRALEKDVARRYPDLTIMRHDLAAARLPPAHDQPSETIRIGPKTPGARRSAVRQSGARFSPESLQRRRKEQIEKNLEEARANFEAGLVEKARAACEEALFIDPQLPAALRLMADITAEVEKRHAAVWVSDARMALARGELDVAARKANEALALTPTASDVIMLLDAIEAASREQARIRQVQDTLKRAKAQMADGAFESVVRVAAEVLALDAGNQSALELQARALEQLDAIRLQQEREQQQERERDERAQEQRAGEEREREEREREARAQEQRAQERLQQEREQQAERLMAEARALRDRGERDAAIAKLAAFPVANDDVTALLASMRIAPLPEAAAPAPDPPAVPDEAAAAAAAPVQTPAPASPVVVPMTPAPLEPAPPVVTAPVAAPVLPAPPILTSTPAAVEPPLARRRPDAVAPPAAKPTPSTGPGWRTIAAASVALAAVASVAAVMMLGGEAGPPVNQQRPAVPAPAPAPVSKPPAPPPSDETRPISPPSRVINDAVKVQNDDDATRAVDLVLKSRLDDAAALLEGIRKRDPNYEGLKDLEAMIKRARDGERAGKKPGPQ